MKHIPWVLAAGLAGALPASAGVIGSLSNFDVVNDTGKPAYGFEIEIDDPLYDHSKLTSIFGYDRVFSFISPDPAAVIRWGAKPIVTDLPGIGVRVTYGGSLLGPLTPSGPYATGGDSCWPGSASWSKLSSSCDHFGISTYGSPALTKYSWIVESAPGSGVLVAQSAALPAVQFAYTPPPPPVPGNPVVPGNLNVVIHAVAPNQEQPENEALWGEAFWVKTFSTEVKHRIDLGNLLRHDPDQEQAEVEIEWSVFQKAPLGEVGGNDMAEMNLAVGADAQAIERRYEFYKYLGPVGNDGEANCNGDCEKNAVALGYVGDFVGAQMAGVNLDELAAPIAVVPEPQTWALLSAGLALLAWRRRRAR